MKSDWTGDVSSVWVLLSCRVEKEKAEKVQVPPDLDQHQLQGAQATKLKLKVCSQSIWARGFSTGLGATSPLRVRQSMDGENSNSNFFLFKDSDWRLGEDSSKPVRCMSSSFSWGILEIALYLSRLFAASFLLHLSPWSGSVCCGESLSNGLKILSPSITSSQ